MLIGGLSMNSKYKNRLTLMELISKRKGRRAKIEYETIEERRRREKKERFFNRVDDIISIIELIFQTIYMVVIGIIKLFDK